MRYQQVKCKRVTQLQKILGAKFLLRDNFHLYRLVLKHQSIWLGIILAASTGIVCSAGLYFGIGEVNGLEQPVSVWFVMLIAVTLQTSILTPPVGFALFYLKGVCPPEIKLTHIYKGLLLLLYYSY